MFITLRLTITEGQRRGDGRRTSDQQASGSSSSQRTPFSGLGSSSFGARSPTIQLAVLAGYAKVMAL
ncbi:hypothetical protein JET76_08160 [Pseudomonas putida]|uniref:hypothetical protein n=1 Tax=Pseudomonas putida TaxID=303 RepID=UPI0018E68B1C|nr:hypothetical protein [Pseudomonas putida]MBI6941311.1 hypothetical protein [Pseudomonas putida]MBI6959549.1 hypothetical protein [Pseudomonas putida]